MVIVSIIITDQIGADMKADCDNIYMNVDAIMFDNIELQKFNK